MLQGTIIENSLADKSILKSLKIERTRESHDWILHSVFISPEQLPELAHSLADGPWYAHFWEPGKDVIQVVFKDQQFEIDVRDRLTWVKAIAYGKALGIPEEQLDFVIE